MTPYESYLQFIAGLITIKDEDREVYTKDFDKIRDYVLSIMKAESPVFKKLFSGVSLFGSHSNNVRIMYPNEFDVIFKLSFPYGRSINIDQDECRPGFVRVDFGAVMPSLEESTGYASIHDELIDLVDSENDYLRRTNLRRWLRNIIRNALHAYGDTIYGHWGDKYKLSYSERGVAHTIYARCPDRAISIDFIPGITCERANWLRVSNHYLFTYKCERWYAIPKPTNFGPRSTSAYTFMICNPKAEHDLLLSKQNLKVVYRLLKSLRNQYDMPRFKSYFLTTAFLWEIERQKRKFWRISLSELLEHMLDVLSDYFNDKYLPFFWNNQLNLLDVLSDGEIESYGYKLTRAYNTLRSYPYQPNLSYERCISHFKLPD